VSGTVVTAFLPSATNPENGTVSYTNGSNNLIASKTDAAGQKTTYSYDSYNRLTQVSHFVPAGTEDKSQRVNYYYDTNPFDTNNSFPFYTAGRVAAVTYGPETTQQRINWDTIFPHSPSGTTTCRPAWSPPSGCKCSRLATGPSNMGLARPIRR
jgi:YD repeat-containing protein